MMQWTDRHCRYFHRTMTRRTLLYTEMVTAGAVVHGPRARLLDYDAQEHPVALQLGGADPGELALAARIANDWGYDELNLNVGCPSDRVQAGAFGAALMHDPPLVARCVRAMMHESLAPVSVKCRIGIDDQEAEKTLPHFIDTLAQTGVRRIIIHARKAWLQGLSPKENRTIPPLDYALVLRMKTLFPQLHIALNGGVTTLSAARDLLEQGLDEVMIGRAAYHDPASVLLEADRLWGEEPPCATPFEAAQKMRPYIAAHLEAGGRLHHVTRHMLGLFNGRPRARRWRQILSATGEDAGLAQFDRAFETICGPAYDKAGN